MRLNPVLAATMLFLSAQLATASDDQSKIDFDQGIDAAAILKKTLAAKKLAPIPLPKLKPLKVKRNKNMIAGPGQYPAVSPLITGSAAYPLGVNLRVDPKYLALPSAVLQPLEAGWTDITAVRSDLLSQASGWEGDNEQLYADGQQLDRELPVLQQRQRDLSTEIGQYNQACTTHPLPPDEYQRCVSWRDSLIRRKSQLDSDITQYNERVNSWNQRSSAIFDRRRTLVGLIENWESRIQQWVAEAKKAIENQCRPLNSVNIQPLHIIAIPSGGSTFDFEAQTIFSGQPAGAPPCEVDLQWIFMAQPDLPNVPMGSIYPLSGKTTTFKSDKGTGHGTLALTDAKSGKGDTAQISVFSPANSKQSSGH